MQIALHLRERYSIIYSKNWDCWLNLILVCGLFKSSLDLRQPNAQLFVALLLQELILVHLLDVNDDDLVLRTHFEATVMGDPSFSTFLPTSGLTHHHRQFLFDLHLLLWLLRIICMHSAYLARSASASFSFSYWGYSCDLIYAIQSNGWRIVFSDKTFLLLFVLSGYLVGVSQWINHSQLKLLSGFLLSVKTIALNQCWIDHHFRKTPLCLQKHLLRMCR